MKVKDMSIKERRERHRIQAKAWVSRNKEQVKVTNKRWLDANKERYDKYRKEYRSSEHYRKLCCKQHKKQLTDPENYKKYLIRQRDYRKFVRGKIIKDKCEDCGIKTNLEIHHIDYKEKTNITILCRKCHRKLHKKLGTKGYF